MRKKFFAGILLFTITVQTFYPSAVYALTSGPDQPEMQKFQPAGVSDMVDLFTGDFKYNIPLMDVGGYPVNLSYHNQSGVEDEASWVGMGWSLSPGAVNRTVRGIPDDFNGDFLPGDMGDQVIQSDYRKEFQKIGAQITLKPSLFAWEFGSASLHLGVYKDNYYGIGADVGASLNFDIAKNSTSSLTAGLGLNSDSRDGVTLSPSIALSENYDETKENNNTTLSGGFSYNTRAGLMQIDLSQSFTPDLSGNTEYGIYGASFTKYFGHTYTPRIPSNTENYSYTFSFDLGPQLFGGYVGIGGQGYVYNQVNKEPVSNLAPYGYLNYLKGKQNKNALMDFNREKDQPFISKSPVIPVPMSTEDYFDVSSQNGSKQYRPYFNGNYITYDPTHSQISTSASLGLTVGAGELVQFGGRVDFSRGSTVTQKWTQNNGYLTIAEPVLPTLPVSEVSYFKKTGELSKSDPVYYSLLGNNVTERAAISVNKFTAPTPTAQTAPNFVSSSGTRAGSPIFRQQRDKRVSSLTYLNATQASIYGLDKTINGNPRVDALNFYNFTSFAQVHKPHHISEITETDEEGKRMVYGIPVYNIYQKEASFSIAHPTNFNSYYLSLYEGLINYVPGSDNSSSNKNGRENIFTSSITSPYTTSFLLTGVLSPDYVDVTGNGISDDDLGTAYKFAYHKMNNYYSWRAPFPASSANYNEGFFSDTADDKANYVFGKREVWYLDTIYSKTMAAVFYKSNREDAIGVLGEDGGGDSSIRLLKLDSIRLFSKADLFKNGANAVPIKVAHFVYDYSLYPQIFNNTGNDVPIDPLFSNSNEGNNYKGKLTLKNIYFTFGTSLKGQSNPYTFSYDNRQIITYQNQIDGGGNGNDPYMPRSVDRWGTYKPYFLDPPFNGNYNVDSKNFLSELTINNNSDFPYALQVTDNSGFDQRDLSDRLSSKWQLNSISTPAGGLITVNYEADDYSYVQNRQAMMMCTMAGVTTAGQSNGLISATNLLVTVPASISDANDFTKTYLSGPNSQPWSNIAYKVFTDLDGKGHYEYVYGYAEIDYSKSIQFIDNHTVGIPLKLVNNYNPVSKQAWQMLQTDLPQFAYENYDNSNSSSFSDDFQAAIRSIVQSVKNFRELFQSYDQTASNNGFSDKINLQKSFIRLNYPNGRPNITIPAKPLYGKLGGGTRVRSIEIADNWSGVTGKTVSYGQQYDYTTLNDQGQIISSGVASYEPQIGNEENPFHEPLNFTEKITWGSDRYHTFEKPFGESYFPAPGVGYSKVKVTNYGIERATMTTPQYYTGYIVNEFYTAKDFPTLADYMPIAETSAEDNIGLLLFGSYFVKKVATSQGFRVVLNDMHGKQKAVTVYDKNGTVISSNEYFYSVTDENSQQKTLNNTVLAMDIDGTIPSAGELLGTDPELITDTRESNSITGGLALGVYVGDIQFALFPLPFGAVNPTLNANIRSYNSISSVKVIHQTGILKSIRTTQNGSTLTSQNLLWDSETGQVLLTQTQNEFGDATYAFHYPAYKSYDGMGGAYQNAGAVFTNFSTDINGRITNSAYVNSGYLLPGDELADISNGANIHGWIIRSADGSLRLIDQNGDFISATGNFILIRSGRRNMLSSQAGSVISMVNPLVMVNGNYQLQLTVDKNILDSKVLLYNENWAQPYYCSCPVGYQPSPNGSSCIQNIAPTSNGDCGTICFGDNQAAYSSEGTQIFLPGYNQNGTGTVQYNITDNFFWIENCDLVASVKTLAGNQLLSGPNAGVNENFIPNDTIYQTNTKKANRKLAVTDKSVRSVCADNPVPRDFGCGPLTRTGIWICDGTNTTGDRIPTNTNLTFEANITAPVTGTYYVGLAGDDQVNFAVDGNLIINNTTPSNYYVWRIYPINLTQGNHIITLGGYNAFGAATIGCEIYNNTPDQIAAATDYSTLNIIFSTNNLIGQTLRTDNLSCPVGYSLLLNPDNSITCTSSIPYENEINPYFADILGNWKPFQNYVYQVNRSQTASASNNGATNIRTSGYYSQYTPFWVQGTGGSFSEAASLDNRWVWAKQSIYYDQNGNEIENEDALQRFGSALYGYKNSAAIAVASNARHNEIAFDGFEDYFFSIGPGVQLACPPVRPFDFGPFSFDPVGPSICSSSACIVSTRAHSGNYSLQLTAPITISKYAGLAAPVRPFLGYDPSGRYTLINNELGQGFSPVNGKKYLMSLWVYDGNPTVNTINSLQISINGQSYPVSSTVVPVVEGWKKLDLIFTGSSDFILNLNGSGIYIDDFRILPFDGQLKSFVYDDMTMRLMGQLDENNFGVFYEYDEEGTLIRVKKETERGIMTVKENRQHLLIPPQPLK